LGCRLNADNVGGGMPEEKIFIRFFYGNNCSFYFGNPRGFIGQFQKKDILFGVYT
jgi:hypothetical protein